MGFLEIESPSDQNYGSHGGPGFNTGIITLPSGAEERVQRWSTDKPKFEVMRKDTTPEELALWRDLHVITRGSVLGFRHKNWFDYTSTSSGRLPPWGATSISHQDQIIGTGDGATTSFQLTKTYTYGGFTYVKKISKPVAGTVVVALGVTQQMSGWTVDTTTGRVLFTTPPGVGIQVKAGFEYREPVRFEATIDQWFDVSIDSYGSASVSSIPLIGLTDEESSTDIRYFGGGADLGVLSADVAITLLTGAVISGSPNTMGLRLFLPDAKPIPTGYGHFFFKNNGTETWSICNSDEDEVLSLPTTTQGLVCLGVDGAGNKVWLGR